MPELPEVEIMTRALDRWTRGRTLTALVVRDPRVLTGDPTSIAGAVVRGAGRRAKYCLLDLGEQTLVLHFRMTGKLVALESDQEERAQTRLRLELDGAGPAAVTFVDSRCLGEAWVLPTAELAAFLDSRKLGPEPWPERHDGAWWAEALAGLRGPVKPALLRQDRVAGLGNICACEALWRARIDPRTPVPDLRPPQWRALAQAVPDFIDHVLATEGALHQAQGELAYVNQGGPNPFDIYGRGGEPCPRCGTPVERLVQSGRGTWWCPACQAA